CPPVNCFPTTDQADAAQKGQIARGEPNVFFPVGNDLLGLIVTTAADGTVLAQHYSHSSHSSHSSHYSHYSGRSRSLRARDRRGVWAVALYCSSSRSRILADGGRFVRYRLA